MCIPADLRSHGGWLAGSHIRFAVGVRIETPERRPVAAMCTTTHKTGMQAPSYAPKCHTRAEKPDLRGYFRLEAMVVI